MAVTGAELTTLSDWVKEINPDGTAARAVPILQQANPMLGHAHWEEGNGAIFHTTTIENLLPEPTFRRINQGVTPTKGTSVQVTDGYAQLENYSVVDKFLWNVQPNKDRWRAQKDARYLRRMAQRASTALFSGDVDVNPEEYHGLQARYNSLSAVNGGQIIDGGSNDTDNRSVWCINWGPESAYMVFPLRSPDGGSPGSGNQDELDGQPSVTAGLMAHDLGEQTWDDSNGDPFQAMVTHFKWDLGFTLANWKQVGRLANLDISDLEGRVGDWVITDETTLKTAANTMQDYLMQLVDTIDDHSMGQTVLYAPKSVLTFIKFLATSTSATQITIGEFGGEPQVMIQGYPIMRADALDVDEPRVT